MPSATPSPRVRAQIGSRLSAMSRWRQAGGSFVAVFVTYCLYWLFAVPLIEPSVEQTPAVRANEEEILAARQAPSARKLAMSKYFPPGSWELENPAIWESAQTLLLFKTPQPLPDGRLKLESCTLLFFPNGRRQGDESEAQPIIMQAPGGATLKFDQPIELKNVDVSKRQLDEGDLKGPITIHRSPSRPGAADDLLITTRDIKMQKDRMWTIEPVQFRLGRSNGSGREMEIQLASSEGPAPAKGFSSGGVRMLTLKREVVMMLELGSGPLAAGAPVGIKKDQDESPIKITCQGPFQYDVPRQIASFHDNVDVIRLASGPSDNLSCALLNVVFESHGDKPPAGQSAAPPGTAGQASKMQVRVIEARGDPVIARSPAQSIYVRCRGIDYYPAPVGATGRLVALGPGVMQGKLPDNMLGRYQVSWAREFRFEPIDGQNVASLRGKAEVGFGQMGQIAADEIYAWLTPKVKPAGNTAASGNWQLERVLAQEAATEKPSPGLLPPPGVKIVSPQLTGTTRKLEAWVDRPQILADQPPPTDVAPPPPRPAPRPQQSAGQRFSVRGGLMRIKLIPEGEQFAVSAVTVENQARLEEISPPKPGEKPLVVEGDRLHVDQANTEETHVTVNGMPGYIEAGGLTLRGAAIDMEKHTNRLWVDGPGRLTMPMTQDLDGRPIAQPQNLDITWQKRMDFAGQNAVFLGDVQAKSQHQFLSTDKLEAVLNRIVDFANPTPDARTRPEDKPQLVSVRCYGRAYLESRQFDERGTQTTFDRMEALDLSIDKITGAINGRGPGWVTHVAPGSGPTTDRPGAPPRDRERARETNRTDANRADKELNYLNVQFQQSITGNLFRREITFGDSTKTVSGPVPNWDAKLDPENPASLGPNGLVMDAKTLTVREMNAGAKGTRGWMELEAIGNVLGEGQQFTARGHRITYSEQKDLLILSGDGRSPAEIFYEKIAGAQRIEFKGDSITYSIAMRHAQVSGTQSFGGAMPAKTGSTKKNPLSIK